MSILDGSKRSLLLRESPLLSKSLLDIGWQQGALFSAPSAYFAWNDVSSSSPPFDLRLVLWVKSAKLTEEDTEAIDIFKEAMRHSLNPRIIHLDPEVRVLTEEEISLAEYRRTRPLFLEYHTYKGEETEGAEPYGTV